jgi:hypothetical protein
VRYYNINITNAQTGQLIPIANGDFFGPFSSLLPGGSPTSPIAGNDPGALDVEFDLPVYSFESPVSAGFVRLWGVGIPALYQSAQFNPSLDFTVFNNIKISAGMSRGLPLANLQPTPGLIFDGVIQQAFGNWQGVQQTIDFVLLPNSTNGNFGSATTPANIQFSWATGQNLADAISQSLIHAFPDSVITNNVGTVTQLPYEQQTGGFPTLSAFAAYINTISQNIRNVEGYLGIKILPTQKGFTLFDGTLATAPKIIQFYDLVGQPTWKDPATINFKLVMRGDINVGDYVQLPNGPQILTAQSFAQYRNKPTFQGVFLIVAMRHFGHFRQIENESWVTSFDAVPS